MPLSTKATKLKAWLAMYKITAGALTSRLAASVANNWFTTLGSRGRRLAFPAPKTFTTTLAEIVTDGTAVPVISTSIIANAAPTKIVLTYGESLNVASVPDVTDFSVTVAATPRVITDVEVSGTTVTLTLVSAVTAGQAVVLNYSAGDNPIEDTTGNNAANLTNRAITNNVA